jgi:hypothetical protein
MEIIKFLKKRKEKRVAAVGVVEKYLNCPQHQLSITSSQHKTRSSNMIDSMVGKRVDVGLLAVVVRSGCR